MEKGRMLLGVGIFILSLVVTTIGSAFAWEYLVHRALYDCTDPGFVDYLSPGNWVHNRPARCVPVAHVVHRRSMSEPDTIKQGWSVAGLWFVWFMFAGGSVAISVALAMRFGASSAAPNAPSPPHGTNI